MTEAPAAPVTFPLRPAFAVATFFALLPGLSVGGAIGLPVIMALVGVAAIQLGPLKQALEKKALLIAVAAVLVAWLSVSTVWSAYQGATYLKVPSTVALGLLCAVAIASPKLARLSLAGALAALIVLTILLMVEALFGTPLNRGAAPDASAFQLNQSPARGGVVMLALLWPSIAWLIATGVRWRGLAVTLILAAVGFASLQFGQASTAAGLAIGALFFVAALIAPRLAILAPALALALWTLAAPFLTPLIFAGALSEHLPHSWAVRIGIWRYTCARILEQPWFGHGLDAGRASTEMTIYDGEQMRVIPVHPHSATMQIWYDAGAVGALLTAALIILCGFGLARAYANNRLAAASAAAVLAMFGLMANIGWSPWQEWWLATVILAGALVAAIGVKDARA